MTNLKDIVNGLETVKARRMEDTRFKGDIVYTDDINEWLSDFIDAICIGLTDDKLLCLSSNDGFLVNIHKSIYQGQEELSFSIQELTLKGVSYFAKEIINFKEPQKEALNNYYNNVLALDYGIDADSQELGGLAELNVQFNRHILHTSLERGEYWLTFELIDSFYFLTKVTHKARQVPVGLKSKGISIPIL